MSAFFLAARLLLGGWLNAALAFLKSLPWWAYAVIAALILLLVVYQRGESSGETKGAAKVTAQVVKARKQTAVAKKADTAAAQTVADAIGAGVAHTNKAASDFAATKLEEMHHAIDDVPPAAPGAAPAPVDTARLSASNDALVAGANRSADAADAVH